jgi:2-oxoglutarate ferredoxin oxidoreductase subunit alpha
MEALDLLERDGYRVNALRIRGFPFGEEVVQFCGQHDRVFVVEQNRDAQMRSLLMIEAGVPAEKLVAATSYDGMPLTAAFVERAVMRHLAPGGQVQAAE